MYYNLLNYMLTVFHEVIVKKVQKHNISAVEPFQHVICFAHIQCLTDYTRLYRIRYAHAQFLKAIVSNSIQLHARTH